MMFCWQRFLPDFMINLFRPVKFEFFLTGCRLRIGAEYEFWRAIPYSEFIGSGSSSSSWMICSILFVDTAVMSLLSDLYEDISAKTNDMTSMMNFLLMLKRKRKNTNYMQNYN